MMAEGLDEFRTIGSPPICRRGTAFRSSAPELRPSPRTSMGARIDDIDELDEQSVTGGFDEAASVLLDLGSLRSRRIAFNAASVPSSSTPISRE